jgi:hypothetical protein
MSSLARLAIVSGKSHKCGKFEYTYRQIRPGWTDVGWLDSAGLNARGLTHYGFSCLSMVKKQKEMKELHHWSLYCYLFQLYPACTVTYFSYILDDISMIFAGVFQECSPKIPRGWQDVSTFEQHGHWRLHRRQGTKWKLDIFGRWLVFIICIHVVLEHGSMEKAWF